jgi:hypothetical protein
MTTIYFRGTQVAVVQANRKNVADQRAKQFSSYPLPLQAWINAGRLAREMLSPSGDQPVCTPYSLSMTQQCPALLGDQENPNFFKGFVADLTRPSECSDVKAASGSEGLAAVLCDLRTLSGSQKASDKTVDIAFLKSMVSVIQETLTSAGVFMVSLSCHTLQAHSS